MGGFSKMNEVWERRVLSGLHLCKGGYGVARFTGTSTVSVRVWSGRLISMPGFVKEMFSVRLDRIENKNNKATVVIAANPFTAVLLRALFKQLTQVNQLCFTTIVIHAVVVINNKYSAVFCYRRAFHFFKG